jgi:PAS domain S-box-containing protein
MMVFLSQAGELNHLAKKPKKPGKSARSRKPADGRSTRKFKERKDDERMRQIFLVSGIGIFDHDHLSDTLYFSRELRTIFGWSPNEKATLQKIAGQIDPEDRERIGAAIQKAHDPSGDGRFDVEHRILNRDGTVRWIATRSQTSFKGRGKSRHPVRTVGAVLDITERKQIEIERHQSLSLLRATLESTADGILVVDLRGKIVSYNQKFVQLLKVPDSIILSGDDNQALSFALKQLKEPEAFLKKVRELYNLPEEESFDLITFKDGRVFERYSRPQRIEGKSIGRVWSFRDISDRKRMEAELLKVQKLESLGVLAGGIAHDFNNVLTGIMGNISLAKSWGPLSEEILSRLKAAEKASLRAKDLATQLLTFSKGGIPLKKPTLIKEFLENSVQFALTGSRVVSRFSITKDLWTVEIDEGQISQVVQNLVINAQQAMPHGGTLRVLAENLEIKTDHLDGVPFRRGNYVRIAFKDTGTGIKKNHLAKIFDPFFTTKHKGSGLGLSISFSIIMKHHGHLTVQSAPGEGTTFYIYLPASLKKAISKKENEELKGGRGRILVIDDEESVLDVAGEMIRRLEYEPEMALSGNVGLKKFEHSRGGGEPFDAVITDLTLPGDLSGVEILQKLKAVDPGVKVIVSSGYSNDPVIADYLTYGFSGFILKPYRTFELSRILNEVLNSGKEE